MLYFTEISNKVQQAAQDDLSEFALKGAIILVCAFVIILTLSVKNKIALAAILAYIVLP